MHLVKSFSFSQDEILESIANLYCDGVFEVDATYGNGSFYKRANIGTPEFKFDIDPQKKDVLIADSRSLPIPEGKVNSVIFDPPFLTYVKQGRFHSDGTMIMANRFGGYWRYEELADHYIKSFAEFSRILAIGGVMVIKCQDIIHNHSLHPTHIKAVQWAEECGFVLKDLYVLAAKSRMGQPQEGNKQKHARIYHSYFLVFKLKKRTLRAAELRLEASIDLLIRVLRV